MSRTVLSLLALSAIATAALISGWSGARTQPVRDVLEPVVWASQPYLRVEYQIEYPGLPARGNAEITGYVYNDYGQPANNVWLEITELDPNGQPVGQITRRVDELIPPKGRAYFDVRVPASAGYQVVPQAGELVEGFGGNSS